jgi:hypothetical protein
MFQKNEMYFKYNISFAIFLPLVFLYLKGNLILVLPFMRNLVLENTSVKFFDKNLAIWRMREYNRVGGINIIERRYIMIGYIQVNEIAKRWDISVRQAQYLCKHGRIEGAVKFGTVWAVPETAEKPTRTGKEKPGRKTKASEIKHT